MYCVFALLRGCGMICRDVLIICAITFKNVVELFLFECKHLPIVKDINDRFIKINGSGGI
jgi:hypothetical protein